jgi:hypothetical protein
LLIAIEFDLCPEKTANVVMLGRFRAQFLTANDASWMLIPVAEKVP